MADLYEKLLQNKCIKPDIIKEAPVKLSVAITLAGDGGRIWVMVKCKGTQREIRR